MDTHHECGGGIILNTKGEIVLSLHADGFFGFPKGKPEAGENKLETARREVFEETGLKDLKLIKKLPEYTRTGYHFDHPTEHLILMHMYLFTTDTETLMPIDIKENPEARWFSIDQALETLSHKTDREYLESIKSLLLSVEN